MGWAVLTYAGLWPSRALAAAFASLPVFVGVALWLTRPPDLPRDGEGAVGLLVPWLLFAVPFYVVAALMLALLYGLSWLVRRSKS